MREVVWIKSPNACERSPVSRSASSSTTINERAVWALAPERYSR
jgi:hypothetical protein